jgi:glycerophosphoryl diester phosphodiesterase
VFHDWDLKTLNGSDKIIEKMPYSEIEKISLHDDNNNKIPLFREVLNVLSKKCIIVVEIKSVHFLNAGIEKNVLEIVKEFNFEENCIISSFNPLILWRIRKLNPNILTAFLWSKTDPKFSLNSPLWVWFCRPHAFHADIEHLDENLMSWIHRKKMSVLTFTVKTSSDLSKAKHLGVDGIIMDDPYLN